MSMLRNVLTYMGLGPDEDYDEGYLSDVDDTDIDLTDEHERDEKSDRGERDRRRTDERPREGRRSSRGATRAIADPADGPTRPGRADRSPTSGTSRPSGMATAPPTADPHAQRERPGWLVAPSTAEEETAHGRRPARDRRRMASPEDPAPAKADPVERAAPRRGAHDLVDPVPERPLRAVPPTDNAEEMGGGDGVTVQPANRPSADAPSVGAPPAEPEIRLVPPRTLAPRSFGDAKELADEFKALVPVVMDLQGVDRELARRLIDFASGICYALDGSMEKMAPQVFLLIPVGVDVSDDERRRLEEKRPTDRS